jgi:ketopantoate reductase
MHLLYTLLTYSKVLRTVADAEQKFDFIICTNKAVDQESSATDIAPGVGDNTSIVIIQNGVGNEDAFRERFPNVTIISCVVCSIFLTIC